MTRTERAVPLMTKARKWRLQKKKEKRLPKPKTARFYCEIVWRHARPCISGLRLGLRLPKSNEQEEGHQNQILNGRAFVRLSLCDMASAARP